MALTRRKYIPYTIAAALACAVLVAAVAPAEEKLGQTVKLIYLHASVTWVALLTFAAAAVLGAVSLARRNDRLASWSAAALGAATLFWIAHFTLGLVVMRLAWGGWFWSEPRVRAGILIVGISIAASLVAMSSESRRVGPALSICVAVFIVVLLSSIGRVFHPAGAIRSADSDAIKAAVAAIVFLITTTAVQVTRLLNRTSTVIE